MCVITIIIAPSEWVGMYLLVGEIFITKNVVFVGLCLRMILTIVRLMTLRG